MGIMGGTSVFTVPAVKSVDGGALVLDVIAGQWHEIADDLFHQFGLRVQFLRGGAGLPWTLVSRPATPNRVSLGDIFIVDFLMC
jgi:hypothetical protein